jgi:hypothetical protein
MTDANDDDKGTVKYLDGNAAAGALSEVFAVDITAATGRCNVCGDTGVFAQARLYVDAPGMVARCVKCDNVLLRVVTTPNHTYLDLRGLTYIRVPNA